MPASIGKKKVPRRVPFFATKVRLAAAGARQEPRVQVRTVALIPTTPAPDRVSTHIGSEHLLWRAGGVLQRNQSDHRTVNGRGKGGGEALYRDRDFAVAVRGDHLHVFRCPGPGDCDFATPVVLPRRAGGTLEDLGNRSAACARSQDHFGYLRPVTVVLVRRECYCGQNADDRNYDHQLDQGKALLNRSHGYSFSTRRYGAWVGRSKSHAAFGAIYLVHCFYAILCHFLSMIQCGIRRRRPKMRHSLTPSVTGASRGIVPFVTSTPRPETFPRRVSARHLQKERGAPLRYACGCARDIRRPG